MTAFPEPKTFRPASPEFASGFRSGLLQASEYLQALLQNDIKMATSGPIDPSSDTARVRRLIRARARRSQYFGNDLFADPAWDILLDLYAAHLAQQRVSVISLCLASGVPTTTALRWIKDLEAQGLIVRQDDPLDRRRTYLCLSDRAVQAMETYVRRETSELPG